jgi:hypothetical protein
MGTTTWKDLLRPGDATDFFARRPFQPFMAGASGYSDVNALWLAELSRLVYRHDVEEEGPPPHPTRTSFLAERGLRQRGFFSSGATGTQALLVEAEVPAFAVLVFRGTEQNPKDFIIDLEVGRLPPLSGGISVHAGFQDALDSIWQEIGPALGGLTCPIFYTGHSLGAALATLAAARHPPQAVYTFGSPLVGNAAFATSLRGVPIYRIVDDQDLVATVPPGELGFLHAGEVHVLQEPRVAGPRRLLARLRQLLGPPKPLADHAPVNYVDRIGIGLAGS